MTAGLIAGGSGTSTFVFNGGLLRAGSGANGNFMSGLGTAYILSGGATIDSNGNDLTIAQGLLDGGTGGGLTKLGSGTFTLSGTSTYTGPTTIEVGNLIVTGSLAKTAVTVHSGAALGGTGRISGSVIVAGNTSATGGSIDLDDGAIGVLTLTDTNAADTVLTLGGTTGNYSLLDFELGTAADRILLTAGKLVVNTGGGKINLTVLGSVATGTYDLIDYGAGQASGLGGLSLGTVTGLPAGYTATLLTTSTAVRVVVADPPAMSAFARGPSLATSDVPEPSTLLLLAAGAVGLLAIVRRRAAQPAATSANHDNHLTQNGPFPGETAMKRRDNRSVIEALGSKMAAFAGRAAMVLAAVLGAHRSRRRRVRSSPLLARAVGRLVLGQQLVERQTRPGGCPEVSITP